MFRKAGTRYPKGPDCVSHPDESQTDNYTENVHPALLLLVCELSRQVCGCGDCQFGDIVNHLYTYTNDNRALTLEATGVTRIYLDARWTAR